jgi:hypothetical protein
MILTVGPTHIDSSFPYFAFQRTFQAGVKVIEDLSLRKVSATYQLGPSVWRDEADL